MERATSSPEGIGSVQRHARPRATASGRTHGQESSRRYTSARTVSGITPGIGQSVPRLERRPRRRGRFDLPRTGHFEGASSGNQGCASGDHVVDDEDAARGVSGDREPRAGQTVPSGPARLRWPGLPHQECTARPVQAAGDGSRQQTGLVEAPLSAPRRARGRPRHNVDRRRVDEGGDRRRQRRHRGPGVAVLQPGHQFPASAGIGERGNQVVEASRGGQIGRGSKLRRAPVTRGGSRRAADWARGREQHNHRLRTGYDTGSASEPGRRMTRKPSQTLPGMVRTAPGSPLQ
jgi:hypothetical protein